MNDAALTKKLNTPIGRLSFPNLFAAKVAKGATKAKFSCTLIFDLDAQKSKEWNALKAAAQAVAIEFFGKRLEDPAFAAKLKNPFLDCSTNPSCYEMKDGVKVFGPGYAEGFKFIRMSCDDKPGIVDRNVQIVLDPSEIYAGLYGIANVNAYGYDNTGNVGVSFGLNHFQKVRDGESLGGRGRAEEAFTPVAGADDGSTAAAAAGKPGTALFGT